MHKLYANNGEKSVNDILACRNIAINYFFMNCIFIKGMNTWQFGKIC